MDAEAQFEALYRAHCGAVRSFVHRRVSSDGADEIVAEVFVAAWRRMDDAPEDGLVWLFGIARGLIANHRRSHHRRQALQDRLATTAVTRIDPGPEHRAAEIDAALVAFASLSERNQELLRLIAWEGLARAQVAQGPRHHLEPGLAATSPSSWSICPRPSAQRAHRIPS
jgi:RNA polymerase sigma-70 factor (ECF subfamily)